MTTPPDEPAGARPRNADATRTELLHAAMRRFAVLGYDRTTTRDIAADAHVNVSLINRYFGSKDGLFSAVMAENAEAIARYRASPPESPVEALLGRLDAALWPEFGNEHPLLLLLGDVGGDERVRELRRRSLEGVVGQLADRAAGGAAGELQAELVLAVVAGVLTVRGALPDGALATTDPERLRSVLAELASGILRGRQG